MIFRPLDSTLSHIRLGVSGRPIETASHYGYQPLAIRQLPPAARSWRAVRSATELYQDRLILTHVGNSQDDANMIHRGKREGFAMAAAIGVRRPALDHHVHR